MLPFHVTLFLEIFSSIAGGLLKEDGTINFECPCLGGMATGPCGVEFREAFTCFHYSEADPKGSDCIETFKEMSLCMSNFPGVYGSGDENVMNVSDEDSSGKVSSQDEKTVSTTSQESAQKSSS